MNTILKRVISLLLCTVMTVGYMPVNAFAMESGETVTTETTEVTAEQTEAASKETEAPSESTESLAELSEVTDDSDEEEEETEKESEKEEEETEKESEKEETEAEKESEKEEKEAEKESEKEEKEAEKEAKKEEKETEKETEPSTEPSTEATEPSTVEIVPEETVPETTEEGVALFGLERASAVELNVPNSEDLAAELERVQKYVDYMMSQNDPETVVKTFKKHFTWDTELRENSKTYLYDWSYYNGVVFEGLEYLYEVTGESKYKDYVVEYMSSLINADGTWANCTNDGYTDKQAAGYNENHGVDTFKTASLLLDAYAMTNDSRYLTMAGTIAGHLENVAVTSDSIGGNYVHTWGDGGTPSYALWLDGLYMTLPFRAEYAEYAGDTAKLQDIVERLTWVSENMYDSDNGLFYHAANANNNSGTFWLRSIGWYAAALADVMDSVDSTQRAVLADQLTKLADGLKAHYNEGGMWLNKLTADYNSSINPYETSGTALVSYALLKAVNNGWIDESYADMALTAFYTISVEKLNSANTTLTDICQKGAPTTSNSTFKDNEGKGVGPFIMLYAEVLEYTGVEPEQPEQPTEPSEPTEPADQEITVEGTTEGEASVTMSVSGVSAPVVAAALTEEDKTLLEAHAGIETYVAIDVTGTLAEGEKATFTVAIPEGWDADRVVGISVEEGVVKEIPGTHADGKFTFTVDHFSAKGVGLTAKAAETTGKSGTGNLVGGKVYTLDTNGVTSGKNYLIVNTASNSSGYALTNNNGTAGRTAVPISGSGTNRTITVEDDSNIAWVFSDEESGTVGNNGRYVYLDRYSNFALSTIEYEATVSSQGGGAYRIYRYANSRYNYLRYNDSWTKTSTRSEDNIESVYLYELTSSSAGTSVTFSASPKTSVLTVGNTQTITYEITLADGTTVNSADIEWASSNGDVATVANGVITAVGDGSATITATLKSVNGTDLTTPIELEMTVSASTRVVDEITVNETSGEVERGSGNSALTGATITITYEDNGEPIVLPITVGMLQNADGTQVSTAEEGPYPNLEVWYNGEKLTDDFTLTVIPVSGNNFPEYPDPGSVDLNKVIGDASQFQSTGVAEVQLSTSGIPMQTGVDAVLVLDLSNSMSWGVGTTTYNNANKLDEVMASVVDFAEILLADNEDGSATTNTVTIITFGGYDATYSTESNIDVTRTLVTRTSDLSVVKDIASGTQFTAENALTLAYYNGSRVVTTSGSNRGDTNYDFAFKETDVAVDAIIAANGEDSNREIHVLFMTDGAPTNFDGVYYRTNSATTMKYPVTGENYTTYSAWATANGKEIALDSVNGGKGAASATAWLDTINTLQSDGHDLATRVYNKVNGTYIIGFDMANGSFSGIGDWSGVGDEKAHEAVYISLLNKMIVDNTGEGLVPVTNATDTTTLNNFYTSLATEIRYAATNAYFVDQMGGSFDLQLDSYVTKFAGTEKEENVALNTAPAITVSTYPIYKQSEVNGTTVTQDMVGQRKNVSPTVVETVVFNADGNAAYSDKLGGYTETTKTVTDSNNKQVTVKDHTGTQNILIDGVICAKNFWYNTTKETKNITLADGSTYALPAETFYWNIGTINELEFVLSYYVYLSGASEGTAKKGTYATNNYATLYYENWLGNNVEQDVQSPALAWESAAVYYGFYLVDKTTGLPVVNQATGQTGSFTDAIKITQKIFHEEVLLNDVDSVKSTISVNSTLVPDEYEVYDTGAQYTIYIDSGKTISGWKIVNTKYGQYKDPTTGKYVPTGTTYVTDYRGTESTNVEDSDTFVGDERTGLDFTATTVWFAVCWEPQALPDTVVIDYGQPVNISVLNNDMFGNYGQLTGVGALEDMPEAAYTSDSIFGTNLTAECGTVTIKGEKVCYTPSTMEMPTYDKFAYEASYTKPEVAAQYYYNTVTVIPATTIYYEDSFLKLEAGNSAGWSGVEKSDATQGEDRPGQYSLPAVDANNVYGYDGAYSNCSTYSLDSAAKVHLENGQYATAEFTFYGTGFDVISLTSNETGVLAVQVSAGSTFDAEKLERDTLVNTYYGMNADGTVSPNTPAALYQVPVMKIENLPYGQYTARITATYVGFFDKTDAAGYDLYLDAIRIYDPAGTQYGESDDADGVTGNLIDGVIQDAYIDDNEGWPVYVELRNHIISAADVKVTTGDDGNPKVTSVSSENATVGAMFIDCANDNTSISDYVSYGPNNELYLAANQAVAFSLGMDKTAWENVADVQIGLKVANGNSVNYKVYDATTTEEADITATMLNTATEMYYSIKGHAAGSTVIKNVSGGILSITNIKITYKSDPNGTAVTMAMPEEDAGMVLLSLRAPRVSEPEVPETSEPEESIPETSAPEESVPETTVPEETVPETTVPEETEDQREQVEQAVKEVVKTVVKTVKNVLQNLFSKWFR